MGLLRKRQQHGSRNFFDVTDLVVSIAETEESENIKTPDGPISPPRRVTGAELKHYKLPELDDEDLCNDLKMLERTQLEDESRNGDNQSGKTAEMTVRPEIWAFLARKVQTI